ncbi:MAG: hypothetical protein P8O70_14475 [SAR324 cluster bacterium]|nr:hypothetical protein [SAR324 cluster bacterium]
MAEWFDDQNFEESLINESGPFGSEDTSELDVFCAAFPVLLIESRKESLEKSNQALRLLANSTTCSDHALVTGTLLK